MSRKKLGFAEDCATNDVLNGLVPVDAFELCQTKPMFLEVQFAKSGPDMRIGGEQRVDMYDVATVKLLRPCCRPATGMPAREV